MPVNSARMQPSSEPVLEGLALRTEPGHLPSTKRKSEMRLTSSRATAPAGIRPQTYSGGERSQVESNAGPLRSGVEAFAGASDEGDRGAVEGEKNLPLESPSEVCGLEARFLVAPCTFPYPFGD